MKRNEPTFAFAVLLAGLAICQAPPAGAATVSVNPTRVYFSAKATSALVSLRNEGNHPLRFQLSVLSWSQEPDGQMTLTPTQDVIFFPQLFTLAGGEERKIRVGTTLTPTGVEKTYRLFVEELPPSRAEEGEAGAVRVLTKIGIPVFLRAAASAPLGELRDLAMAGGRFTFTLANKGTTHFTPDRVSVRVLGPRGETAGEQPVNAWYILAGSTRVFQVALPDVAVSAVVVEVRLPGSKEPLTARLEMPRLPATSP